jgi:hypothetical protein
VDVAGDVEENDGGVEVRWSEVEVEGERSREVDDVEGLGTPGFRDATSESTKMTYPPGPR